MLPQGMCCAQGHLGSLPEWPQPLTNSREHHLSCQGQASDRSAFIPTTTDIKIRGDSFEGVKGRELNTSKLAKVASFQLGVDTGSILLNARNRPHLFPAGDDFTNAFRPPDSSFPRKRESRNRGITGVLMLSTPTLTLPHQGGGDL